MEEFSLQTTILPKGEVRALWVVRHALTSRDEVDRAVDFAVRARFHLLFVQVRGRGDAYYQSRLEPDAPDLELPTHEFDPLEYFIARAHGAGIAVHAWVNVFYVWSNGNAQPPEDHIVRRHPEWLIGDQHGDRMGDHPVDEWKARGLEGYYVAPSDTAARRHTVSMVEDLASRYAVDGIHLDYVRYPGERFGAADHRTRFALRYGVDLLALAGGDNDPARYLPDAEVQLLDSLRIEWRAAQVDTMVMAIRAAVPHLPLSAAVVADPDEARVVKGQDWVRWVHMGYVDFVVPMAYRYRPGDLIRHGRVLRNMIGDGHFLLGVGVFDDLSRYLAESVSLIRGDGLAGFSIFSYNALADRRFPHRFLNEALFEPAVEPE